MKTAVLSPTTEAAIWARVIHPSGELTPPVARAILKLEFSADDGERMHKLAQKAQEGDLTPEEQFEIDNFERVGNLLAILKSQARKLLKRAAPRRASSGYMDRLLAQFVRERAQFASAVQPDR